MLDPSAYAMRPARIASRRFVLSHRAHAGARGPLWSAISVALAAAGCAPRGPIAPESANAELMALKPELESLAAALPRITAKVVVLHGTQDDLVPVANVPFMQSSLTGARWVKTVLLEGRNHFLPWNSEAVVRDAIRVALEPSC